MGHGYSNSAQSPTAEIKAAPARRRTTRADARASEQSRVQESFSTMVNGDRTRSVTTGRHSSVLSAQRSFPPQEPSTICRRTPSLTSQARFAKLFPLGGAGWQSFYY